MKLTKDHIRATPTFQSLSPVIQKIVMTRNNYKIILHGVEVARNIGLKKWEQQSNYTPRNRAMVIEILESLT